MRITYLPDPNDKTKRVIVDIPIPSELLKTLDAVKIAEYIADQLAIRFAKARNYNLDDPRVIVYKQGQYDWLKGWLIEHILAEFERFSERVIMSNA